MIQPLLEQDAAYRYDRTLQSGLKRHPVPAGCPVPQPTSAWPPENVALLERYHAWLVSGDDAPMAIAQQHIPVAGYALGLNLKPHDQLDLEVDLDQALAFIQAKGLTARWTTTSRLSLEHFRHFLRQERGLPVPDDADEQARAAKNKAGLPPWLLARLEQYYRLRRANWRKSRRKQAALVYWCKYTRLWHWLLALGRQHAQTPPKEHSLAGLAASGDLALIRRQHLFAFIDELLAQNYAAATVNVLLYCFQATLRFLESRGHAVPRTLLRLPGLKVPDRLPRHLTDGQVKRLRQSLETALKTANTGLRRRDALMNLAAFYLLWQGGLRGGELEDLAVGDIDFDARRVAIRQSKGMKDRTVYLTEAAAEALSRYLEVRGDSTFDHVFLHRRRPLSRGRLSARMRRAGQKAGVKVTAHMLRHTFATQLLNVGCDVTSIQALMGHKDLDTTMVYARAYDATVASDYYKAMDVIEDQLTASVVLPTAADPAPEDATADQSGALLQLLDALPEAGDLTDEQAALLTRLRGGILALAGAGLEESPLSAYVNVLPLWPGEPAIAA